jgi:two-component system response regulator DesR
MPRPVLEDDVIRILLVEQMALFRGALAFVLSVEEDMEVICDLAGIDNVVNMARAVQPDVAVIDIDLFAGGAVAVVQELNETAPECAVLVLASGDSPGTVRGALDTHVRGFIGKDTVPSQLVGYIRRVANGEPVVIDPDLAVAALGARRNPLTAREREVIRQAASGVPFAEIALQMHLSVGTVRNYMSTIIRKTGGRNRWEAVHIATHAGWL